MSTFAQVAGSSTISQLLIAYRVAVDAEKAHHGDALASATSSAWRAYERRVRVTNALANEVANYYAHEGGVGFDGTGYVWHCSCGVVRGVTAPALDGTLNTAAWDAFALHRAEAAR